MNACRELEVFSDNRAALAAVLVGGICYYSCCYYEMAHVDIVLRPWEEQTTFSSRIH